MCKYDFNESERKSSQVHARSGQTESKGPQVSNLRLLLSPFGLSFTNYAKPCEFEHKLHRTTSCQIHLKFELEYAVGCSSLLFSMVIDWITRKVVKNERTGIQWTLTEQLEDLDFPDDVCLISAEKLSVNASKLGINVNIPKTKVLKVNAKVNSPISLGGEDIE